MKDNKIILAVIVIFCIICTSSCKKGFLKPEALSFYTPDNTFNTVEGLQSSIIACERNLRHEFFGDGAPIITQLLFSEVAVEGTTDKSGPAQNMNLQITPTANLNSEDFNRIGWYWIEGYKGIKYANTAISFIDLPEWRSEEEKNALLGAAYFHRAYRYYMLTNEFGDVPAVMKEVASPRTDFFSVKREVILQKMKEDLEFAAEWVPVKADKGQVTKGAVNHLLTKINLALGDFDDAITSATRVIDDGVHKLMTERFGTDADDPTKNVIWDLHRPANKDLAINTEALMLVIDKDGFIGVGDEEGGSSIMRQTVPFWASNILTPAGNRGMSDAKKENQPLIDFDFHTDYGRGIGRVRETWYSTHMIWEGEPNDLRHAPGNWMRMEDLVYNNYAVKDEDPYYGKHLRLYNDQGGILCTDTIRSWFDWPHYKVFVPDNENSNNNGGHTDWYVFRLAETYLLRAEAYFWKGNLTAAANDLNEVRERAGAPDISDVDINIGTILDERARELFYEEPRKVELTRISYLFAKTGKMAYNGKTYSLDKFSKENFFYDRIMEKTEFYNKDVHTNHGDEYTISPYHVLWPVPQNSINLNVNGVINQNEGYSGFENNVAPLDKIPED